MKLVHRYRCLFKKRYTQTLFVFLFLAELIGLQSAFASPQIIDSIIATVDEEVVLLSDFNSFKSNATSGGLMDESLLQIVDLKDVLSTNQNIIDHLINERLLDVYVKKFDLEVTFERVDKEIETLVKNSGMTEDRLKIILQQKGVSWAQYQDFVKIGVERRAVIEKEITSKIRISDDDIMGFYIAKHGAKGSQSFEYKLSHILLLPKNGGPTAALQRAQQAKQALKSQPFEKVAKQYSEDPNFAPGGLLGDFKSGEMLKEIEQAVTSMSVGQITDVLRTSIGFQIIKIDEKKLVESPQLQKEKMQIQAILTEQQFKRRLKEWLTEKRTEAKIRINKVM